MKVNFDCCLQNFVDADQKLLSIVIPNFVCTNLNFLFTTMITDNCGSIWLSSFARKY
jgi:ethanolamine ammonia-lyase large subunit